MSDDGSNKISENRFSELIENARAGNQQAIGELIVEYREYLLLIANQTFDRTIQAKLGPSDIVQQTMLLAQRNVSQFRGENEWEFRGWIRQIMINNLRETNRSFRGTQRRNVGVECQINDSFVARYDLTDPQDTPRTDALRQEQESLLLLAIAQLPPLQQQLVQLRNWDELSFTEIGERINCSPDAARKKWFRTMVKLQQEFYTLSGTEESSLFHSSRQT